MTAIESNTSASGYWEVQVKDRDPRAVAEIKTLVTAVFENKGSTFCYYLDQPSCLPLDMDKVQMLPVDKYVACRAAIVSLLDILSFVCVETSNASKSGLTKINISSINEYDRLVTDPSVSSALLVPPALPEF